MVKVGYATGQIGHVLRNSGLLHEIIEGRMKGKPTRGRRRIQMLHDLANGDGFVTLRLAAENRGLPLHRIKITCASDSAFNVDTVHLRNV